MIDANGISGDEMLEGIRSWVEIESPTFDRDAVNRMMDKAQGDLAGEGASVERIPGRNGMGDYLRVRSQWGGDGKGILVLAHLDTVWSMGTLEKMPWRIDGDQAHGPGVYDMKSGAYIAYYAFAQLLRAKAETPLPITLCFVPDEEHGSLQSRWLIDEEAQRAKYALVVEPSVKEGGAPVVTCRKGSGKFHMTVHGRGAHAGGQHHLGRSATLELAHQIIDISSLTDYDRGVTTNVSPISGGTRSNVIADRADADINLRFVTMEDGEELIARIQNAAPKTPDVTVEVTGGLNRPPMERSPANLALLEKARAVAQGLGFDLPEQPLRGGGSDGNLTAAAGVPTLDGLGAVGDGAHADHEHIMISSLAPRAALMLGLMQTLD